MKFSDKKDFQLILSKLAKSSSTKKIVDELLNEINASEDNNFQSFDEFVLNIQQVLWNELGELIEPKEEVLLLLLLGLKSNKFDIVDLKVLINKYEQAGILSSIQLIQFTIIFVIFYIESEITVESIYQQYSEFTSHNLDLKELTSILTDTIDEFDYNSHQSLVSAFSTFDPRIDIDEFLLQYVDDNDLIEVGKWLPRNLTTELTDYLIKKLITNFIEETDFSNFKELIEKFNENSILRGFPINHQVFGEDLGKLPARAIDMDELENVPQKLVKDWAPKFVYSQPEFSDNLQIYFPGGRNIGHSAIVIKSTYGSVLLDYGLSVVNNSMPKWLPILEKVDAVLLSHAHMDHSGSLPLLYGKQRSIPWFATRQTRIMCEMLWNDTQRIVKRNYRSDVLNDNQNLRRLVAKGSLINTLQNYNQIEVDQTFRIGPDIEVTARDATHLFGSVGYELQVGNKKILYTGDFNKDKGASFDSDADISIFDSTYFERYDQYPLPKEGFKAVLENSNKILIPAFSMGRTQEILFELKHLQADKDWKIYLTGMGGRLTKKLNLTVGPSGGGKKTGVSIVNTVNEEDFNEKTIVISGQGMLQVGTSRNLFDATANDEETSVVICGYQAPNTLGYHLLNDHEYLKSKYKQQITRVKLSGHTTGEKLDSFMDNLQGRKVMVHSPLNAYENRSRQDVETPLESSIDL